MAAGVMEIGQQKRWRHTQSHSTLPYPTLPYPTLAYPTLPTHLIIAFLLGQVEGGLARHILGRQGAARLAQ